MHISWATGHTQCRLALNPCCCSPALTCGCMTGGSGHSQIINLTRMLFLVLVTVACEPTIQPTASAILRECAGLLFEGQKGQAAGMHQELYTSGSHLEHSPCVEGMCIPRVSKNSALPLLAVSFPFLFFSSSPCYFLFIFFSHFACFQITLVPEWLLA